MVIHYTRSDSEGGQTVLRDILSPLVNEILTQTELILNISPVDVYKAWINQMESETGEKSYVSPLKSLSINVYFSKLPYEVSNDQALEHEEVRRRIGQTIQILIDTTERFQETLFSSVNRIP